MIIGDDFITLNRTMLTDAQLETQGSPSYVAPSTNTSSTTAKPTTSSTSGSSSSGGNVSFGSGNNPFHILNSVHQQMAAYSTVEALIQAALEKYGNAMDEGIRAQAEALFTLAEQVKMVSNAMNALNSLRAMNAHKDNKPNATEWKNSVDNLRASMGPLFAMNPEAKTQFDKLAAANPATTSAEDMNRLQTLLGETLQNISKSLQLDQQRLATELQQAQQQKSTVEGARTGQSKSNHNSIMKTINNI